MKGTAAAGILLLLAGVTLVFRWAQCRAAVKAAEKRLAAYGAKTIRLGSGDMTLADKGQGETILSVHGIFGGYDQAFDTCAGFAESFRILAPSRFGYPGSGMPENAGPKEQASAYAELRDRLGIDKVFVLAASAGGSVAFRFALDYPERTKGLVLYCSAMPPEEKPAKVASYAGPPPFLCNDFAMYLMRPLFGPLMGMAPDTVFGMMPVGARRAGAVLDASVTNLDMQRNLEDYDIRKLRVPVLILHAKDDKLASWADAENAARRIPDCTFVSFETGGHLMEGHGEAVHDAVLSFTERNKG